MACQILSKLTMLLAVLILLVTDYADFLVIVNILRLGVIVDTVVNFVGSLDEFGRIQLNVAGTYRAAVACKNVLRSHPELAMFLADYGDFIYGSCIIDL